MSIESVMSSSHLIICCPLLLLASIFPSIRVFCKRLYSFTVLTSAMYTFFSPCEAPGLSDVLPGASWVRSPGQPRPLAPGERSTSYLAAALPTNCVSQTEATPTRCWWHGKQQRRMQEKHFSLIHDIITTECSFLTYPEFHGGVKFVRTEDLNTCVHFVRI